MDAKNSKNSVANILAQNSDKTQVSAYGLAVKLLCKDLTLLNDRARLHTELAKHGIDVKAKSNAIQTAISQTRNIVTLLAQNGWTK